MKKYFMTLLAVAFLFIGVNSVAAATDMSGAKYEFLPDGTEDDGISTIDYTFLISNVTFDSTKNYEVCFSHSNSSEGTCISGILREDGKMTVSTAGTTVQSINETAGDIYITVKENSTKIAGPVKVNRYTLLLNRRFNVSFLYQETLVNPKFAGVNGYNGRNYTYKIGKINDISLVNAIRSASTREAKQTAYQALYNYAQTATVQYTKTLPFGHQESVTRYMLDLEEGSYYFAYLSYTDETGTYYGFDGIHLLQAANCNLTEVNLFEPHDNQFRWPCGTRSEGGATIYYGPNGTVVTAEEYANQCSNATPTCGTKNGKWYDKDGNEVTEEAYHESCDPKPTCEIKDGKYYDANGNVVTEEEYKASCAPKCKIEDGKYYDKDGNEVTEEEYHNSCDPKPSCEEKDGKYYDKDGNEIPKEEYDKVCAIPDNPKTGVNLGLGIAFIVVVLGVGIYSIVRKKNRFPQA